MARRRVAALLPLLLAAWALAGPGGAGVLGKDFEVLPEHMLELTDDNFDSTMADLPEDRWTLVEFYAHWCPHCQHFAPEYAKVAAFFGERGEQEPVVTVARLDCANHAQVCNTFGIHGYPSMRLGLAADFAAHAKDKLTDVRPASRDVAGIVAFIGKQLDVRFGGSKSGAALSGGDTDGGAAAAGGGTAAATIGGRKGGSGLGGKRAVEPFVQHEHPELAGELPGTEGRQWFGPRADLNDIEGATSDSWRFIVSSPILLKGPDARQGLKDWVALLAAHHPVERCRRGASLAQDALSELWPDDQDEPTRGLDSLELCPGSDFKDWHGCRGATPDSRGYTCGLWQLFHTLASRLPDDDNAGAVWLAAVKGFVGNYFQCSECATHFMRHAAKPEALGLASKRDAVLWMWKAHNIVNRRLGGMEKAEPSKGDPAAPHVQFPPVGLCKKCRKGAGQGPDGDEAVPWDEDAVYRFLLSFYSGEQALDATPGKLSSQHSNWSDAGLLVLVVAACVYTVLRRSSQYGIRKVYSRSL